MSNELLATGDSRDVTTVTQRYVTQERDVTLEDMKAAYEKWQNRCKSNAIRQKRYRDRIKERCVTRDVTQPKRYVTDKKRDVTQAEKTQDHPKPSTEPQNQPERYVTQPENQKPSLPTTLSPGVSCSSNVVGVQSDVVMSKSQISHPPIPPLSLTPTSEAKTTQIHAKEYRIPLPEEDPVAALVMAYKITLNVPFDDRSFDKKWPKHASHAKELLNILERYDAAYACLREVGGRWVESGHIDWTIAAICEKAPAWRAKQGGREFEHINSERFLRAVTKQRSDRKFAGLRKVASDGEVFNTLRDSARIQPDVSNGNADTKNGHGRSLEKVRNPPLETPPSRDSETAEIWGDGG